MKGMHDEIQNSRRSRGFGIGGGPRFGEAGVKHRSEHLLCNQGVSIAITPPGAVGGGRAVGTRASIMHAGATLVTYHMDAGPMLRPCISKACRLSSAFPLGVELG